MRSALPSKLPVLIVWTMLGFALAARSVEGHQPHYSVLAIGVSPTYSVDQTIFVAALQGAVRLRTFGQGAMTFGINLTLKSVDGGVTWTSMPNLANYRVMTLAVSPDYAGDGTVFAATLGGGLYKTTDGGSSWRRVGLPLGGVVIDVALSPNYGTDRTGFAIGAGNRVFRSSDAGESWTELPSLAAGILNKLALSPSFPVDQTLLVGSYGGGILRSTNGGNSWAPVSKGLASRQITAIAFSPSFASDRVVFTSTFGGGVFISRDGGTTWAPANSGISDLETTALVMSSHFERDSTLLAASANAGVFKSTDEGRSWSPMAAIGRHLDHNQSSVHFRALALAPDGASDVVFLGMYEGFWKSAGAGSTWQFVDLFPSHLIRSFAMSPDYPNDHTLFASTYGGGIVATFDGGQTWTFLNTGLSNPWADPMAISPDFSTDRTVFSGTIWGPQSAVETGENWQLMSLLGVPTIVRAIAPSPRFGDDSTVFMGTFNTGSTHPKEVLYNGSLIKTDGLFRSIDRGLTWAPTALNGLPSTPWCSHRRSDRIARCSRPAWPPEYSSRPMLARRGLFFDCPPPMWRWASLRLPHMTGTARRSRTPSTGVSSNRPTVKHPGRPSRARRIRWSWTSPCPRAMSPIRPCSSPRSRRGCSSPWTAAHPSFAPRFRAATSPRSPFPLRHSTDRTLFAATSNGIAKSEDGGSTWAFVSTLARHEVDRPNLAFAGAWTVLPISQASSSSSRCVLPAAGHDRLQLCGFRREMDRRKGAEARHRRDSPG